MVYFITGGDGKLGQELCPLLDCTAPSESEVDVLNYTSLLAALQAMPYKAVIHLAAFTDARQANEERNRSYMVNVIGTRNVARAAKLVQAKMFYISTDYVFPGTTGNYSEKSNPLPANWYGYTKYAGELEIQTLVNNYCIIRTSFRPRIWEFPTAFTNVFTSADYVDVIAKEIAIAIQKDISGIIHIGTDRKSFYALARQRTPDIQPEICTDQTFPKKRDFNITQWKNLKRSWQS